MTSDPVLPADGSRDPTPRVVADRYSLYQALGADGTSTVWRGQDVVLGRPVTVRELTSPIASTADREVLRQRIRREVRAVAALGHPAVLAVDDVVDDGPATYLVTRCVDGRTLAQVVAQDGPLKPADAARVGLVVLGALRAAHAHDLVHGEVEPANVLVGRPESGSDARVLLTGFGLAPLRRSSAGLSPWSAPEQARSNPPGPAADLWSLGATLLTAVEGRTPASGHLVASVRAGPLRPVLERLLEPDPAARISAEAAERALGAVVTDPEEDRTRSPVPLPAVRRTGRSRPRHLRRRSRAELLARAALATAAVVAVLALALLVLRPLTGATAGGAEPLPPTPTADASSTSPPPPSSTAAPPPLLPPPPAGTPVEQLQTTADSLADLAERSPGAVGSAWPEVLADLREVARLEGPPQRVAAVGAGERVVAAVTADSLDAGVGQRLREVLDAVARPERLIDLVQLVDVDRSAVGPAGQEVWQALFDLDHRVPADETAAAAAALLQRMRDAATGGELVPTFLRIAEPTLQRLADPAPYEALQGLLAGAEADPESIGPAAAEVTTALRDVAEQPVWPQGNAARDLIVLLREDGSVTPAFRDAATPVLEALVR